MDKTVQFKYTDSAAKELHKFQSKQVKILEQIIKDRKYVYGDSLIEVTGSDVQEASHAIRAVDMAGKRRLMRKLLSSTYLFIGFLLFTIGIFYDFVFYTIFNNPTRSIMVAVGLFMIIASSFISQIFKIREEKEFKEIDSDHFLSELKIKR